MTLGIVGAVMSAGLAGLPAAAAPDHGEVAGVSIPRFGPVGHDGPMTLAHRGDSGEAPENTLPAIYSGIVKGADYVEIDLRQTRDPDGSGPLEPTVIVMHDATPFRTTNAADIFPERARDDVNTFTLSEIRQLDAGSWNDVRYAGTRVPTLSEALRAVEGTKTGLLFEFKHTDRYPGIIERSVDEILMWAADNPGHPLAVGSIDVDTVRALKLAAPQIPRGVLAKNPPLLTDAELADMASYAEFMGTGPDILSAESVERVHAAGMKVIHNTSTRAAMVTSEANGADGTMTDYPARKRETIAGLPVHTTEAESLTATARTSASVRSRPVAGMAGGKFSGLDADTWMQMWESGAGDWMELDLSVPADGTYLVSVVLVKGCQGGVYDVSLDRARVLTGYDGFRPGCHRQSRETVSLGLHKLSQGTHTVRFTVTGKAAASGGYRVSADVFELRQL